MAANLPQPMTFKGFKTKNTVNNGATFNITAVCKFFLQDWDFDTHGAGAGFAGNILLSSPAAFCVVAGNITISGNASCFAEAVFGSVFQFFSQTIRIVGVPAISWNFAVVQYQSSMIGGGSAYTGTFTGNLYDVSSNGIINTAGGGANFFPGTGGGSSGTQGQYL